MGRIGILALQGGVGPHRSVLERLGHEVTEVRGGNDLDSLDGLILPGGESSTQLKLIGRWGLTEELEAFVVERPIFGTCAGLILAARRVVNPDQHGFGWLDVTVCRNGWGRQLDSFEARTDAGCPAVFIRAPRIVDVGSGVEILDTFRGEPIMVRQGHVVGACFHPELTGDVEAHRRVFGPTHRGVSSAD